MNEKRRICHRNPLYETMTPDLAKVAAAVQRIEAKNRPDLNRVDAAVEARVKPMREIPSPIAADSAIRKPLRAHGIKCSGFFNANFLNRD